MTAPLPCRACSCRFALRAPELDVIRDGVGEKSQEELAPSLPECVAQCTLSFALEPRRHALALPPVVSEHPQFKPLLRCHFSSVDAPGVWRTGLFRICGAHAHQLGCLMVAPRWAFMICATTWDAIGPLSQCRRRPPPWITMGNLRVATLALPLRRFCALRSIAACTSTCRAVIFGLPLWGRLRPPRQMIPRPATTSLYACVLVLRCLFCRFSRDRASGLVRGRESPQQKNDWRSGTRPKGPPRLAGT